MWVERNAQEHRGIRHTSEKAVCVVEIWDVMTKGRLTFTKEHLDDPQAFSEHVLWTDETKAELFKRFDLV